MVRTDSGSAAVRASTSEIEPPFDTASSTDAQPPGGAGNGVKLVLSDQRPLPSGTTRVVGAPRLGWRPLSSMNRPVMPPSPPPCISAAPLSPLAMSRRPWS